MSEGPAPADEARPDPDDTGLFGKLPRSRPGTRSPRRTAGGGPPKAERAKRESRPRATATRATPKSRPAPPPADEPERAASGAPSSAPAGEDQGAGLEELAWAGIAVTAEAATLGVRLMSRALDAARRATERG